MEDIRTKLNPKSKKELTEEVPRLQGVPSLRGREEKGS